MWSAINAPRPRIRATGCHRGWWRTLVVAVGGMFAANGAAAAAPAGPGIEWIAEPSVACQRRAQLQARVGALAGNAALTGDAAIDARVTVARVGARFHAVIEIHARGQTSQRSLESSECDAIVEASALILAVSADPVAVAATFPPPKTAQPRLVPRIVPTHAADHRAPPQAKPTPAAIATRPTNARPTKPHPLGEPWGAVMVRGHVGAGVVPGIGSGVGGAIALGRQRLTGRLGASYWAPNSATHPTLAGVAVLVDAWSVEPQVCGSLPRAPWSLVGCAGPELGRLRGSGTGAALVSSRDETRLWAAASATLTGRIAVHRVLSLGLWLSGAVPIVRPRFVLSDATLLYQPSVATIRGGLELAVRFW